jgi:hypothetical protein
MLLRTPASRVRLADRLDKVVGQLRVERATQWEAGAELEALRTSAACVWDLVLGSSDGSSSPTAYMSTAVELLEGWIGSTAANKARWGSRSMLVAIVLHFPEVEVELEVLRSRCSVDLIEDEAGALWT